MSWINVDNKHKKKYDRNFVSCEETYERAYIKQIIKEEFSSLSDSTIDAAISSCCASVPAPRPRQAFWNCLRGKLGVG
jgi:hypothetical protein